MSETAFRAIRPEEIGVNVIQLIGQEWMLVTAGDREHFNTMTASWGGLGHLWEMPVCFTFVRPQRYTYEFMERSAAFTLTFFAEQYRPALTLCGSRSGRHIDKVAEAGLTPRFTERGAIYFDEAWLVLECRKVYAQDLTGDSFVDSRLRERIYSAGDFHRLYVGQITHCWMR